MSSLQVLNIGTDRSALDPGSRTRARFERYARGLVSLTILVPGTGRIYTDGNLRIVPAGSGALLPVRLLITAIREARTLTRNGPLVITAQDPFEIGIIALIAARLSGARLHIQAHIDPYDPYFRTESIRQRFQSLLAPRVLKRADRIRVVSPRIQERFAAELGVAEGSIDCIPIASDIDTLISLGASARKDGSAGITVLALSRFVLQKNIPLLLRAFAHVHKKHPHVRLQLVGSGPEQSRLVRLASSLGIADVTKFRAWSENPAMLIASADIFALSSDYEGWGMTPIEAAALGTPVVMTDVGCAGSVIRNEESGLVVPVRDEALFAAALERLVTDPALRQRLAAGARAQLSTLTTGPAYDAAIIASWEAALATDPT